MDEQPELVGGGLAARGAIGGEVQLVRLDQVFRPVGSADIPGDRLKPMAAGAVDRLVQPPRRTLEVGDDEPAIGALRRGLHAGDDLPRDLPGLGGIAELGVAARLGRRAGEPSHGGGVGQGRDLTEQSLVAGEAEDVADPVPLQPAQGLGPAVVAVAADQDLDPGPVLTDRADEVAQDERDLGPARGLARPQDDGHRLAGGHLIDRDRQEAAAVVMGVEQGELLLAVNAIRAVVPTPRTEFVGTPARCPARCGAGLG